MRSNAGQALRYSPVVAAQKREACMKDRTDLCHEPRARHIRRSEEVGFLQFQQVLLQCFSSGCNGVCSFKQIC